MQKEYTIYAYERNQVELYAVLGDTNSRSFIFHIIEKSGTIMPSSNAEPVDQRLNLTGYTPTLRVIETGAEVTGSIIAETGGIVSFVINNDFTVNAGDYQCEIVLTKSNEKMSIIGIKLKIDYPEMPGYDITIESGETKKLTFTIYNPDGSLHIMTNTEALVFCAKRSVSDTEPVIYISSRDPEAEGDGYNIYISSGYTQELSGDFLYAVYIEAANEKYPLIKKAVLHIERGLL